MQYKSYMGSIEVSLEDDCLHGRILFINDLITYEAEKPAAIKEAFQQAVDRYLKHCAKIGKNPDKTFSGSFNIRIGQERHKRLAHKAMEKGININEAVCKAIDKWEKDEQPRIQTPAISAANVTSSTNIMRVLTSIDIESYATPLLYFPADPIVMAKNEPTH